MACPLIRFPKTELIVDRAKALRVPVAVIVRDLARTVEIRRMLTFMSEEIEIRPAELLPTSDSGRVWKSDPVEFDPIWLTLALERADRRFKVDMAGYGVIEDGQERPLTDHYELGLFEGDTPSVNVMRIEEIAAEKTLGWCAHRLYKHLADLAFIAENFDESIDPKRLREILDGKLAVMRELQPRLYEELGSIDDLIAALIEPGVITLGQERGIQFLRNPYTPEQVTRLVRDRYVPLLRA